MSMEIFLTLLYAILLGFYNIFRKLALKKSSETTIMVIFTTTAFLLSLAWIPFGIAIPWNFVLIFALKGFLLALCWYIILKALSSVDLSIATVTTILSAALSFILGILIFNESAGIWQIVGSVIIVFGVAIINVNNKNSKGKINTFYIVLLIISALIVVASNIIDKYVTTHLTAFQTQFWFLLFATIFSWIFFAIECIKSKKMIIKKSDLKNIWTYLAGIFLFAGDIMLFLAYKVPGSKLITISILLNLKAVVTVIAGIFIFKEKDVLKKIILTLLVILGAVLISAF